MRRLSTGVQKLKSAVRALPDFSLIWETERRLEPFGSTAWDTLSMEKITKWGSMVNKAKKHELMNMIAQDLGDHTSPVAQPLKVHEAYSFSASVTADGTFRADPPLASLPCRMFRVYGPHRFLRVHYVDIPKHSRLGAITFAGLK